MGSKLIRLHAGRERSLERRHPWVYSGAVAEVVGDPAPGDTVEIESTSGAWLARGAYSPASQIRARIWTWDREQPVDEAFVHGRIDAAIRSRHPLASTPDLTAYREVHAESDGLPGLILDRYNDLRVVQFLTAGIETWRPTIVEGLAARGDCRGIFERSDVPVRPLEGLQPRSGHLWGEEPEDEVIINEIAAGLLHQLY